MTGIFRIAINAAHLVYRIQTDTRQYADHFDTHPVPILQTAGNQHVELPNGFIGRAVYHSLHDNRYAIVNQHLSKRILPSEQLFGKLAGKDASLTALHRHSPRHYRISEETEEGRIYRQHIGIVSAVLIQNMCTLIGNNQAAFRYLPVGKINRIHIHSGTGIPIAVHVCQRQHHRFRMNAISVHRKFAVDVAQQDDAASQAERQPRQADEGIGPGARQMTQCVS